MPARWTVHAEPSLPSWSLERSNRCGELSLRNRRNQARSESCRRPPLPLLCSAKACHALVVTGWKNLGRLSRRIYPGLGSSQARPDRGLKLLCSFRDPLPGRGGATPSRPVSPQFAARMLMLECAEMRWSDQECAGMRTRIFSPRPQFA